MIIEEHISLESFHTFRIPVTARRVITIESEEDLPAVLPLLMPESGQILVVGQGSNLLFTRDFDGTIIRMLTKGREVVSETGEEIILRIASGEVWDEVVAACVEKGWGGIENLSMIPGLTGAAPVQNIGAYGVEMKDVVVSVDAVNLNSGEKRTFFREACEFGYRESIFLTRLRSLYLITHVTIRLSKVAEPNTGYGSLKKELEGSAVAKPGIREVREAVCRIRSARLPDPQHIPNAGSFFKNPVIRSDQFKRLVVQYPDIVSFPDPNGIKLAAAWLIEQCGWKGKRIGDAGVHPDQPLVLINYGHATGEQIFDLASGIRDSVLSHFGIMLEPEVNIL